MKTTLILVACILAATAAAVAISAYIVARRIATGLCHWQLPEPDNVVSIHTGNAITQKTSAQAKQRCDYPKCRCPLDAPYDPDGTWCAIGLPKGPRS